MIKLFISQPMNGLSDDVILKNRELAIKEVSERFNDDVYVIESFLNNVPNNVKPLWYLGESLKLMSDADVVYFADGWQYARGCKLEHECALEYGIQTMYYCLY